MTRLCIDKNVIIMIKTLWKKNKKNKVDKKKKRTKKQTFFYHFYHVNVFYIYIHKCDNAHYIVCEKIDKIKLYHCYIIYDGDHVI